MGIKKFLIFCVVVISISIPVLVNAQTSDGIYIDPNRGQKIYRKTLVMNSNRVESILGNWGIFGKSGDPYSGVWPKGTGHGHILEMTMLVAAEVTGADGKTYHVISESFGGDANKAPDGTEYWWNPLPGYANENRSFTGSDGTVDKTSYIAHSSDATTWPATWPGKDNTWDGTWNGYFGKNQFNADDEAMYVTDDFYNSEYPYYPFASDTTKRGLGLQCETRLFQWVNPLAQDQIFIHFRITNIGETAYNKNIYFGAFADTHPGGLGSTNDMDNYDRSQNMVWAYAYQDKGIWTKYTDVLPGYMGWKYLESPGNSDDGIDNDGDGLIDERRDNGAGTKFTGKDNIIREFSARCDTTKFLSFYGYKTINDVPAVKSGVWWTGDENGNWDPEFDDVGSDGIGPTDVNYVGPDADGTEGNGKPDQGEPHFGTLDKDESDQIGLTSFYSPLYGSIKINQESRVWTLIQPGTFETPAQDQNNLWVFASGPFNLKVKQTERFSVCWIFGADEKTIYRNAITSQNIYNYNYKFTKPPLQPKLKAVAGDHKVTLYWNNLAERSVNPVYGLNFEGYRIYRGTDAQLTEAQVITDGYGNITYYKPTAQFDLVDGVKGMHPVALGSEMGSQYSTGIHYYMGDDSGLQYSYEDATTKNGVTYYYAIVAYDKGYYTGLDDRNLVEASPSESPFSFTYNYGTLVSQSQNTAIVTPNAQATNYNAGHTDADNDGYVKQTAGSRTTGKIKVDAIDPDKILDKNKYEITFVDTVNTLGERITTQYSVTNKTTGAVLIDKYTLPTDTSGSAVSTWPSTIFDGLQLNFQNVKPTLKKVLASSDWAGGVKTNLQAVILQGSTGLIPANFTLEVTDAPAYHPFKKTDQVYFKLYDTNTLDTLDFLFSKDVNGDNKIGIGDEISVLALTSEKKYVKAWKLQFIAPVDSTVTPIVPQPGDKYYFVSDSPFGKKDIFQVNTTATNLKKVAGTSLNEIAVVPNPYVLTATWEKPSTLQGRGERKVYFIHLPAECTIHIFTQNGTLIKTLHHTGLMANGSEPWDITTSEGLEVAFGIYVFHIDCPGIGSKIGTFAIIN